MSNLDRSIDLEALGLANARHITDLIVRRQRDVVTPQLTLAPVQHPKKWSM